MGIIGNIWLCLLVVLVITVNGAHNAFGDGGIHLGILGHVVQEVFLKSHFIFPVIAQLGRKICIVGIGKGIGSIVDQLSQGVLIPQIPRFFMLKTPGDGFHKSPGIAIVMPPKPLVAKRAFEICNGIPIGFNTADLKRQNAVPGPARKITLR